MNGQIRGQIREQIYERVAKEEGSEFRQKKKSL